MSFDVERLYGLLPAAHRIRDAEQGGPLRALIAVIADQAAILEENVAQLHDDQFVETAAPWALPYLGDLLGIEGLPGDPLAPRAEVANTLAWRRRKGTAHVLERIARDVTGMQARAVEYFELLAATQYMNHRRPANRSWVSVRGAARLEHLGGPFERMEGAVDLPHTVDVRRIARGRGRYNIPNVGIFLWRLRAYRLTQSPAVAAADAPDPARHFRFSPTGNDAPLFNRAATEDDPASLAMPVNVPGAITRRAMHARPGDYYGADQSILVVPRAAPPPVPPAPMLEEPAEPESPLALEEGPPLEEPAPLFPSLIGGDPFLFHPVGEAQLAALDLSDVAVCDLSTWTAPPEGKAAAIDPVLGRITFADAQPLPPLVTFHYGFGGDLGGGEYDRGVPTEQVGPVRRVSALGAPGADHDTIGAALDALAGDGVVEVIDGGRYEEDLSLAAGDHRVTLRAADGRRPTLVLPGDLSVTGGAGGTVTLDGLLVIGGGVHLPAPPPGTEGLGRLVVRHCTLVPGRTLDGDGEPVDPGAASLRVESPGTEVRVERSIVGAIRAVLDVRLSISDSVVDATRRTRAAVTGLADDEHGPSVRVGESTVVGRVRADALELASNTLLLGALPDDADAAVWPGPVLARRTQEGCVRFSYVPPGSRTPRRFQCQPARPGDDGRVRPVPRSTRYGHPAYCVLHPDAPTAIRAGADDESEMGAFHHLHLARREAHLRTRLDEYLRFGLEAGVFYAT
jgi:hypothetical protein